MTTIEHEQFVADLDVAIEMDDGNVLRADVYRPTAAGRYPVLISHGPYNKGLHWGDYYPDSWNELNAKYPDAVAGTSGDYMVWETVDPEKWVPEGYVVVRVDSRGAGRSPGYLDPWSPREIQDYHDCIEWAGSQPWSNGNVGTSGISYYSISQWLVAATHPKHLKAICPWEGFSDIYRDASRHGGIVSGFLRWWYEGRVIYLQHGQGNRGPTSRITGELTTGPETLPALHD